MKENTNQLQISSIAVSSLLLIYFVIFISLGSMGNVVFLPSVYLCYSDSLLGEGTCLKYPNLLLDNKLYDFFPIMRS